MSKKMVGMIYKATNKINRKSYIGQTTQTLRMRRNDHNKQVNNHKRPKPHFVRALIKHGTDSFEWTELYTNIPFEQLDNMERWIIHNYDTSSCGGNGYNTELGGNSKKQLSEETKKKISNSLIGRKRPREVVEKVRRANKGKPAWNKGKRADPDAIRKMIETSSMVWEITCPNGEIKIIKNLSKYCRDNKLSQGNMHNTATGRVKQCKGYKVKKLNKEN